jgi:hypothetical protein
VPVHMRKGCLSLSFSFPSNHHHSPFSVLDWSEFLIDSWQRRGSSTLDDTSCQSHFMSSWKESSRLSFFVFVALLFLTQNRNVINSNMSINLDEFKGLLDFIFN